ncbi:Endonuclease domain-containing 1 protein [Anabarilius grahami]|uniref:Endonuclease domain-containing 1 protein n=1 Tax=Anabarilius grahami TaxID=495550 RepID=A0A3N0YF84_ANAGA|nr:Endonuclease domain-containing 1 protein [Anabarilius grahami]
MKLLVFLLLPYLSLSEVFTDFSQCSRTFLNNHPPQFTLLTDNSVKHICQCVWVDIINRQKMYLYATLYNTTGRIPIYSAYVFGSPNVGRCDPWYIEPQLDLGNNAESCMSPQGHKRNIGKYQTVNSDYDGSGYDRGHLYPVQHTDNHLSMLATSTLTNAAPQNPTFNQITWKKHEEDVIKDLKDCKGKAYVVTGVFPDTNIQIPKYDPRVTVSKYYWRATCCLKNNKFTGQGYFGPDNNGKVQQLSITDLQEKLEKDYKAKNIKINDNIIIFPSVPSGHKRPLNGCN